MHSIENAVERIGVSRSTVYELIRDGQIHPVKIGRRTYVTDAELRRFVATLTAAQRGDAA